MPTIDIDEDKVCTLLLKDVLEHEDVANTSHKGDLLEHICSKVLPTSAAVSDEKVVLVGAHISGGGGCGDGGKDLIVWKEGRPWVIDCKAYMDGNNVTAKDVRSVMGALMCLPVLFKKIPGVYGSGVIPVQYVSIRETIKDVIMGTFFDPEFLEQYIGEKLKSVSKDIDTDAKVKEMTEGEEFDKTLDAKLATLGDRPELAPLAAFGGPAALKPMIKPFVSGLGLELAPLLKEKLTDPKVVVDIDLVRDEIEKYMDVRMKTLTAKKVTRLMEFVIMEHLGWLVVWGNVFGAIIGVLSEAASLTPEYRHGNSTMA